jgi:uncharacterized protein YbjT (DUF2867 family)
MKVLVVGASGGTGRAAVAELKFRGHEVTAFVRRPETFARSSDGIRIFHGDVMCQDDLNRAVKGQDAVIVVLGISENPLLVRLRGSAATPMNVRSAGTRNVVAAMRGQGIRRLVVQTTYGAGDTRGRLPLKWKLIFSLLLRVVRASGLDWMIVQPVGLKDTDDTTPVLASADGETRSMAVSRKSVARVLVEAVQEAGNVRKSIAVSACL